MQVESIFQNVDQNTIEACNLILRLAYPSYTLKDFADPDNEPETPVLNDCYLVSTDATVWGVASLQDNILRWNGTSWELLPHKINEVSMAMIIGIVTHDSSDAFTISSIHANKLVRVNRENNVDVTIPLDDAAVIGTVTTIIQIGEGRVILNPETDGENFITLNAYGIDFTNNELPATGGKFSALQIIKVAENTWDVIGADIYENV